MINLSTTTKEIEMLSFFAPVVYLLITGDFPGSSNFFGLEEDSTFVDFLFNIRSFFTN